MPWYKLLLMAVIVLAACKNNTVMTEQLSSYVVRLKPGEDLKAGIEKLVKENNIEAGWIAAVAGSLTQYNIRFANQPDGAIGKGHFEIVSLTGTLSVSGSHLHICISDSTGKTIGGHLLEGCKVYTTAEIVITASNKYLFAREKDGITALEELQVRKKQ